MVFDATGSTPYDVDEDGNITGINIELVNSVDVSIGKKYIIALAKCLDETGICEGLYDSPSFYTHLENLDENDERDREELAAILEELQDVATEVLEVLKSLEIKAAIEENISKHQSNPREKHNRSGDFDNVAFVNFRTRNWTWGCPI